MPHHPEHMFDQHGREAHRRLVEQQEFRFGHQRATEREHLLLATGQRSGRLTQPLLQAGKHVEDELLDVRPRRRTAGSDGAELKMLGDREVRKDLPAFGHVHDPAAHDLVRIELVEPLALELDRASPRCDDAGDRAQQRRLAGTVRAEHGREAALLDIERNVAQHQRQAVARFELPNAQHASLLRGKPR